MRMLLVWAGRLCLALAALAGHPGLENSDPELGGLWAKAQFSDHLHRSGLRSRGREGHCKERVRPRTRPWTPLTCEGHQETKDSEGAFRFICRGWGV